MKLRQISVSRTGGSDVEDEPCNAMDVCLACVPSSVLRSPCCYSRPSTSNRAAQRHLWLHAFILFLFAVALAGLAYYTMTLQTQLAILRVNLEPGKQKIFGITYQLLFEKYLC